MSGSSDGKFGICSDGDLIFLYKFLGLRSKQIQMGMQSKESTGWAQNREIRDKPTKFKLKEIERARRLRAIGLGEDDDLVRGDGLLHEIGGGGRCCRFLRSCGGWRPETKGCQHQCRQHYACYRPPRRHCTEAQPSRDHRSSLSVSEVVPCRLSCPLSHEGTPNFDILPSCLILIFDSTNIHILFFP